MVCVAGWDGAESCQYFWQLKESWRTDRTNDLTAFFSQSKPAALDVYTHQVSDWYAFQEFRE